MSEIFCDECRIKSRGSCNLDKRSAGHGPSNRTNRRVVSLDVRTNMEDRMLAPTRRTRSYVVVRVRRILREFYFRWRPLHGRRFSGSSAPSLSGRSQLAIGRMSPTQPAPAPSRPTVTRPISLTFVRPDSRSISLSLFHGAIRFARWS